MPKPLTLFVLLATLAASGAAMCAPPPAMPSRGRLLYDTHCIECHNSKIHWRDGKLATNWPRLVEQVRRWQSAAGLQWSEADINEVAHYLNDRIYRYPSNTARLSMVDGLPSTRLSH